MRVRLNKLENLDDLLAQAEHYANYSMRNIGRLLASMLTFRMPDAEVSLDNPQSLKVPYGVALALTTVLYSVWAWKMRGAH